MKLYQPPLSITARVLELVADLSKQVGVLTAIRENPLTPQQRRANRIRTIQASLAIENSTLDIDQVTAVLDGKRVLGLPREIQEVRNAFTTYEAIPSWSPTQLTDLLAAHRLLMHGLIDDAGQLRKGGVGIYRGDRLLHMAPPASRLTPLMHDLLQWLAVSDWPPLITSCVFHYEFEFIHPFADGNGRMGRLWQTLILSQWRPVLAYLPVESVICARQEAYYAALAMADQAGEATPFVEFMLEALQQALREASESESESTIKLVGANVDDPATVQVTDQITDPIARLLAVLTPGTALKASELMKRLGLAHRPTFNQNYLKPALAAGLIEMTDPASPRSPLQQYRRV